MGPPGDYIPPKRSLDGAPGLWLAGHAGTWRRPAMKWPMAAGASGGGVCSMRATRAEPMTAASANWATAATWAAFEMPKPRAMGRSSGSVKRRRRATSWAASDGDGGLGAGDADAGDGVDEALRRGGDGGEAGVGRGGRGEEDGREVVGAHCGEVFGGLFDDHVGEQDAVDAGLGSRGAEGGQAHADDGIEVGEEDEAGSGAGVARSCARKLEDVGQADAAGNRAFAGALDDGAVGEGVAEGDAELDHVGAGVDGGEGDGAGVGEGGVACGEVGDDAGAGWKGDGQFTRPLRRKRSQHPSRALVPHIEIQLPHRNESMSNPSRNARPPEASRYRFFAAASLRLRGVRVALQHQGLGLPYLDMAPIENQAPIYSAGIRSE